MASMCSSIRTGTAFGKNCNKRKVRFGRVHDLWNDRGVQPVFNNCSANDQEHENIAFSVSYME